MMDLNLKGKVALVTGGAGGIGRTIAAALLREGCEVYVADLNLGPAKSVTDLDNVKAHLLSLDVADAREVQRKIAAIVDEQGKLDILVNSAGILKTRAIIDSTIDDWDEVSKINLSGVYYCSKAVLPAMVGKRYGKIINIASVSSIKGGGALGNVLYGATKAGVVAMTKGFARELAPYGINVNAISPGVVEGTSMIDDTMTPEVRQRIAESFPMKRFTQASEVASLAIFLASDISQAITGQSVVIDCGFLVR